VIAVTVAMAIRTCFCVDINECVIGLEPCSGGQRCENTPGSFLCQPQQPHHQRPSSDDHADDVDDDEVQHEDDGGRQRDVAVDEVDLQYNTVLLIIK